MNDYKHRRCEADGRRPEQRMPSNRLNELGRELRGRIEQARICSDLRNWR